MRGHILLADSDPGRRATLADALRKAGCDPHPAPDGAAAAAALAEPGFDAVLLDLRLPGLDRDRLRLALAPEAPLRPESLEAVERRQVAAALQYTGGNKRQAALLLGISRSTLLHKVRRFGLAGGASPS